MAFLRCSAQHSRQKLAKEHTSGREDTLHSLQVADQPTHPYKLQKFRESTHQANLISWEAILLL